MRSYTEREFLGDLTGAMELANHVVSSIPHLDMRGEEIRCHELARAVWHALQDDRQWPAVVVDGKFAHVDHSWVVLRGREILEVYAVGSLPQVQLLCDTPILTDARALYRPSGERSDIREDVVDLILWACGRKRHARGRPAST